MSTRELFGDSSSEEEEEEKETRMEDVTKESEKPQGDEPDDDKSDEPTRTIEDDDDDDDVEFDDQGVVGLPSTTLAGEKENVQQEEKDDEPMADKFDNLKLVVPNIVKKPHQVPMHVTRLPNLVGIQTTAFDPDTYFPSQEEEEFGQSVFNLMRWRYQTDAGSNSLKRDDAGNLVRESNTRLVQWEDGSYTLHIGKESFEVDSVDNTTNGFAGLNGYLYLSQKATLESQDGSNEPAGTLLESMGPMASRMTARPSSLQSEAHKSLTVAVRQKTIKKARIAEFVTQEDPEKLKQERIRVQEDLDKARKRKRDVYRPISGRPRMSRSYLEEEEDKDYDTFNIRDTKRRMRDADEMDDYGEDSDDDDEDDEVFHTLRSRAKEKDSDDDIVMDDDDDDEEEEVVHVHKVKKPTSRAVLDDEDDSD